MTLERTLREAAFWHQGICLSCAEPCESFDDTRNAAQVCEECSRGVVVSARMLSRFVERVESEEVF